MKRLLLASILMAFGASAQAVVVVGNVICSGDACLASLDCDTHAGNPSGTCTTELLEATLAICLPISQNPAAGASRLAADKESKGEPGEASCTWRVTDPLGTGSPVEVTIDNSDGLPVELQSLSVE